MRVVAGLYRGRRLTAPMGSKTRPTAGRVKEAIFSAIADGVPGSMWLDLFAGSGAMGIEALSRGADFCLFCDSAREACAAISKNLSNLGIGQDKARLMCGAFGKVCTQIMASTSSGFDFIYIDPPFGQEHVYNQAITYADKMLGRGGTLIIEHSKDWRPVVPFCTLLKTKRYGLATVSYYRKRGENNG